MKKGWITEVVSDEPGSEKKRLYSLTELGKEAFKAEIERLKRMIATVTE